MTPANQTEEATALLPPATVIDVGRIEGRGWAVVEANPAWGAGICACDATQVLPVLRTSHSDNVVMEWLLA